MGILAGCEEGLDGEKYDNMDWDKIDKAVDENWEPLPPIDAGRINKWLLEHEITIKQNPCISPDFCLDWPTFSKTIVAGNLEGVEAWNHGFLTSEDGEWRLAQDKNTGDHAWFLQEGAPPTAHAGMESEVAATGTLAGLAVGKAFPATFKNLIALKKLVLSHDNNATIFPTASGTLDKESLGLGARFTALHYPATEWAMVHLNKSLVGNQNSIPRELIYDVNEMLNDNLDQIDFPFIGSQIPEGHQGTSVEGMTHCSVLSKVKTGFFKHRLPWGFNADHQPIGGKFDKRENELVRGCVFASYITFDISHEFLLSGFQLDDQNPNHDKIRQWVKANIPKDLLQGVKNDVGEAGIECDDDEYFKLLAYVWPAMKKMKVRDAKYRKAREAAFGGHGTKFFREMSIDELPGLTKTSTLATILSLCKRMEMPVQYVAPAFGFQKNCEYPDNNRLKELISAAWKVCNHFNVSIGFHSGSGKSAKNYQQCGEITNGNLEIKTSGRYTYEMGRALCSSEDEKDQKLWDDWYNFTVELAANSAMQTENEPEREKSREFIVASFPDVMAAQKKFNQCETPETRSAAGQELENAKHDIEARGLFETKQTLVTMLKALKKEDEEGAPDLMFWFEYNFLFVLAKGGSAAKSDLGSHSPEGFKQRARFYSGLSDEAQLNYAKYVVEYIIFLARNCHLVEEKVCDEAIQKLELLGTYDEFLNMIAPQ